MVYSNAGMSSPSYQLLLHQSSGIRPHAARQGQSSARHDDSSLDYTSQDMNNQYLTPAFSAERYAQEESFPPGLLGSTTPSQLMAPATRPRTTEGQLTLTDMVAYRRASAPTLLLSENSFTASYAVDPMSQTLRSLHTSRKNTMSVSNWSMDTPSLVNSGALTPINFDMFKTYELDVPNYTNSQKALVASHDICSTDNTTDWPLMFPGVSSQSDVAYPKASMCACGLEQSSASYSDPTGTASMPPTEEISGGEADMTSKKNTKPTIEGQIAPDNWKAGGGIRETEPLRKSSGRFFETYEEAMAEVKGPAWKAPKHDAVPTSDAELAPFVDKLMVAMLSLENIVDSASTTMKNRFFDENWVEGDSQTSITNPYYPKHMLEKLAWQLVKRCQTLHLQGPGSMFCLDPLILEESFAGARYTFRERIDVIGNALRRSKNRVKSLLRGNLLDEYLLVPDGLIKKTLMNNTQNATRQKRLDETAIKVKDKCKGRVKNGEDVEEGSKGPSDPGAKGLPEDIVVEPKKQQQTTRRVKSATATNSPAKSQGRPCVPLRRQRNAAQLPAPLESPVTGTSNDDLVEEIISGGSMDVLSGTRNTSAGESKPLGATDKLVSNKRKQDTAFVGPELAADPGYGRNLRRRKA